MQNVWGLFWLWLLFCTLDSLEIHNHTIAREDRWAVDNCVALWCEVPVHLSRDGHNRCEGHKMVDGILLAHAIVWSAAKGHEVLAVLLVLSPLRAEAVRIKGVRIGVALVAGTPYRRYNQRALRGDDFIGELEVLQGNVRHKRSWGPVAKELHDYLVREGHLAQQISCNGLVVGPQPLLLLLDPVEHFGIACQSESTSPDEGSRRSVLRSKQEVQSGAGDFMVGAVRWSRSACGLSFSDLGDGVLHPKVQEASRFLSFGHSGFGTLGAHSESSYDLLASADGLPQGVAWEGDGEGKEALVHHHVVLGEFSSLLFVKVWAYEYRLRGVHVQIATEHTHGEGTLHGGPLFVLQKKEGI